MIIETIYFKTNKNKIKKRIVTFNGGSTIPDKGATKPNSILSVLVMLPVLSGK